VRLAPALDLALRAHIAYFLAEVMANPEDHRFKGKAIPLRNLIVVGSFSLLFPALQLLTRRWQRYPWALDSLYLSIFWLDMAGNSLDLYDRYRDFDLIPHFHGTGALAVICREAFGMSEARAFNVATGIHGLLELQENLTDVFFGTHNVRGHFDTFRDITAGLAGTVAFLAAHRLGAFR
jgi:hypothetical protein